MDPTRLVVSRAFAVLSFALGALAVSIAPLAAQSIDFESPHVHPIALTPDGTKLLVAHTSDHRLAVFDLTGGQGPVRVLEAPVGLDPVTVRPRGSAEAWVVCHLSDAVDIVDLTTGNVVRTLVVGDEPTDVVFAGSRAFVCVSQEDLLRVYDLNDLDAPPIAVPLSMSDPRSLALSPDGSTVYVCALDGQNKTTIVPVQAVMAGGGLPPPNPPMDGGLPPAPATGLIVRHDGTKWVDEIGRNWNAALPYTLTDHDVLGVSTTSLAVTRTITGVGTTLFNVAVNPITGVLYVTNQEALNHVRFEPNLRAQFIRNRLSVITPVGSGGSVVIRPLNPHIDYGNPAGTPAERALSLAVPTDVAVSGDGSRVYVAAFGSAKVGVLDASGTLLRRIDVGQGASGLALDEPRQALYVVNRFPSTISVVDLTDDGSVEIPIGFDPSSPQIRNGRRFLYDGAFSSAHGDASCASCHVFGTMDNIAWDLGDPQGDFVPNGLNGFHPMKGPMTTQSLKGLSGTEPLHWRGDRADLAAFSPAFVNLMGRSTEPTGAEFQAFEDFLFSLRYPPNPNQLLDGSLPNPPSGVNPTHGQTLFMTGRLVQGGIDCVNCHALPTGENGLIIPAQLLQEPQDMKVPQLRNMFEKTRFDRTSGTSVRGFGFTHDGAIMDLFTFLQFSGFRFQSDNDRRDVAAFLLTFGFEAHAAVGAQWTMDGTNEAAGSARVNTLVGVAGAGRCGLIAKGRDLAGQLRGWLYEGAGSWSSDRLSEGSTTLGALFDRAAAGHEVTFTAVVAGTEFRLGVDRDGDGYRDRDELDQGSDPADPLSTPDDPVAVGEGVGSAPELLSAIQPNPVRSSVARFRFELASEGPVRVYVHDVRGRLVRVLRDDAKAAQGRHDAQWDLADGDGHAVANGVYFIRVLTVGAHQSRRVVVAR